MCCHQSDVGNLGASNAEDNKMYRISTVLILYDDALPEAGPELLLRTKLFLICAKYGAMVFNIIRCIQCHLVMVPGAESLDDANIIKTLSRVLVG